LAFSNPTTPIITRSRIPPPRKKYKIPLVPVVFTAGKTVVVGRGVEVVESRITSVGARVTVNLAAVPIAGSPVIVVVRLGLDRKVATAGLAVKPGVEDAIIWVG
jgi:hypothetical protein